MKQIQIANFGQPSSVAKCVDVADVGAPAPWEVVVHVEAFPINAADLAILSGRYGTLPKLPATVGMEAVGVVRHCGRSVTNVAEGDRVILLANNNWAELRKVPATTVHKVPHDFDPLQLAMLKVNPATAHLLLSDFANLAEGDWIIQTAPLGTVGRCVIQLAKQKGIRTINLVRDIATKPEVVEVGGDLVLQIGGDLNSQIRNAIGCNHVALAVDAVGGVGTQDLADCLADNGTVVLYGMLSGDSARLSLEQAIFRNISLRGFWLSKVLNRLNVEARTTLFDALGNSMRDGTLKLAIDSIFPIECIADALRRAEQPHRKGKVIVTTSAYGLFAFSRAKLFQTMGNNEP